MKFFKDSVRELKHVVWPTKKETINYFVIIVTIFIIFWAYILVSDEVIKQWITAIKQIFNK